MNSDVAEYYVKEALVKAEMESENYRTELEETQKKLSNLTEQLDNVLKYNCKLGVGMDYVIATVNELQSLMEWTAEKKEMKADSTVILQKLQQLERIQKDLEKTATESEQIRSRAQQERALSLSEAGTTQDEGLEDKPEDSSATKTCGASVQEDHIAILDECVKKIESLSSAKSVKLLDPKSDDAKNLLLIDLHTPEPVEVKPESSSSVEATSSKRKSTSEDSNDSLGPNISEDEGLGEESRRGDSTGPSSFIEIQDTLSDIARLSTEIPSPPSNEIVITDPEGHDKPKVWPTNLKGQTDSLDICLCAIGNLRESLRAKENELLKLSAIQNDQKQIAALQDVIINLHKESAGLRSELDKSKKENSNLKEQVLELEEAENDARLQAQKLGEKLVFLQEKDTHFQAKLCETKQALEKCLQELTYKESDERELRSQLKYTEELVHKYEDQVRTMEIVELALRKKLIEEEDELQAAERSIAQCKSPTFERGTQMYEASSTKSPFREVVSSRNKTRHDSSRDSTSSDEMLSIHSNTKKNVDICVQVPDEDFVQVQFSDCSVQTESPTFDTLPTQIVYEKTSERIEQNVKAAESPSGGSEEITQSTRSKLPVECPIQNELLKRLHQLVEEDAHLQQQLHYVDQINLTLWKKLHNLEFHIGECKKKNMSEDGASDSCFDSECDFLSSRPVSREQMSEDTPTPNKCASPCSNRGIIACLDQSEQEIKERLSKLEQINAAFEKELELREKLYTEKEKKYGEWVQTEQRFIGDLKRLSDERDSLKTQVENLQKEKEELSERVLELQSDLEKAQERHRSETAKIKQEQQETISQLQQKVDQLLAKEKDHLKQITNLKLEKGKDKSESDKLKSSYVELQLELSRTRDEMRKKEEEFRIRLDDARSKHCMEEARLVSELEMLRSKNTSFDEMISNFKLRQNELMDIVKQKEEALEQAREEYKKNMEITEEEHRAIEAELKSQLRQMEEETSVATRALTEERVRLEKELQENIDDLRCKEEVYKARISELENNVTHLHDELHRITGDLDSGFGSDIGNDGISNFRREKLLNQLRELRDRESELREKLDEMEQKEAAYRETLEHADRIVASVEQGYKNKIEELEISEKNLKQRVGHLEEVETRLRGALHKERRSSDGRKPDDLVVELLEAEARENGLKEKLETLEQMQRSSVNKVKDLEKIREKLESELNDKEELASNLKKTQQELETARKALTKLKKSETDLKNSLQQTENILATSENQMKSKIRTIEEEKKALEETIDELRAQVRDLKRKLEKVSCEKEENRLSTTMPKHTVIRAEVPTTSEADEPDYVDVEECVPAPQIVAKPCTMPGINNLNKLPSMNSSKLSHPYEKPKTTQIIKDSKTVQSSIPNSTDSYDSARQNLEDCMLRAMAAMKNEMEKKKLNRELNDNRMKQLLSNSCDSPSVSQKVSVELPDDDENDYDEVLPRPTNLRVVQQVGSDTLLIGWNYVNPSLLEGFEVYVDGTLHETVYTPDRTKALISGLNLKRPLRLSISAMSKYGQMSEPTVLDLPPQDGNNGFYLHGDDDDEDDSMYDVYGQKRPYSMEW